MSEDRGALIGDVETAVSELNRVHAGVSDGSFAAPRDAVGYLLTQLIRIKEELSGRAPLAPSGRSAGIARTIMDQADYTHPLAGLCLDIEHRYNRLAEKQNVSA